MGRFGTYILLNMPLEVGTRVLGGRPFRLGGWLVEPSLNRISRGEESIQLELKWMDVLVCLAERAGEVVTRFEIIDRVWATEFITDNTLTHTVAEIRNALGDDAKNPTFIETIRRGGYRLIAPVKPLVSEEQVKSRVAKFPVTPRPFPEDDDRNPYPGMSAFTEADAEFFFGREAEVAKMWRKLTSRRLLAVIGPSGVGKSSFLRAGVIPAKPEGWGVLIFQPGGEPLAALARALVPEFGGDDEAISRLVHLTEPEETVAMVSRWHQPHDQALLIVDQFEELFTLNPTEVQARFSALLRLLVDQADVSVLLSMRDDYLHRCHDHDVLGPLFDSLTPVKAPSGKALRRALVEPARRQGFAFEDDNLPDEMIEEIEGERGALPLLAFAVAQLWDKRDLDQRTLARQAYIDVGGVGGALARHAEATLKSVGDNRMPIVREVFRNLVTAEGTRAVRESDDLLSVFPEPQRADAEMVLSRLIDARLLTSFEDEEVEGDGRRRIEVVHETLLSSWPRLVRWQTKDADAAQLRDELRQAAWAWDEHDRPEGRLWTGTAFREYQLWREHYPGRLTDLEGDFARAMTVNAKRRKRRRRIAVLTAFVALLAVLGIVGVSRQQAIAEANRAEAAKLLALAEVQLTVDPTEALAYATASLELADDEDARIFLMKALWRAPPALVLTGAGMSGRLPRFSPDGTLLAVTGHSEEALVWSERGTGPLRLPGHPVSANDCNGAWWASKNFLMTGLYDKHLNVWEMPEGRLVRTIDSPSHRLWQVCGTYLMAEVKGSAHPGEPSDLTIQRWKLPQGEVQNLGSVDRASLGVTSSCFDPSGQGWVFSKGNEIYHRPFPLRDNQTGRVIGRHDNDALVLEHWSREPDRVWSQDRVTGERRCWSLSSKSLEPVDVISRPPESETRRYAVRSTVGKWLCRGEFGGKAPWLWDLSMLPGSIPIELRANTNWYGSVMDVHPSGTWLAASTENWDQIRFWPLEKQYPSVVEGYSGYNRPVVVSPDGEWFATIWGDGTLRLWPFPAGGTRELRTFEAPHDFLSNMAFDRAGQRLVTVGFGPSIFVISLADGSLRRLEGFSDEHLLYSAAFSPSGRFVAAGTSFCGVERKVLRVWDLETGDVRVFDLEGPRSESEEGGVSQTLEEGWENGVGTVLFVDESTLLTTGAGGVRRWNLENETFEVVIQCGLEMLTSMKMSDDQALLFTRVVRYTPSTQNEGIIVHHLAAGTSRVLDMFGDRVTTLAIDPMGEIVATGDMEGVVRVGRVDGGEPHLLLGHVGQVNGAAISPNLEWLVTAGQDETLRLWPMPDLSKPPLHTLPHDELIAKLKTLTNLRVVRDEESSTGWMLTHDPFPGWETVPGW